MPCVCPAAAILGVPSKPGGVAHSGGWGPSFLHSSTRQNLLGCLILTPGPFRFSRRPPRMASPTSHASSPILTAQDITWAQLIRMSGQGTTWAAHTPLVDRNLLPVLPMDIHVLICLDPPPPTGFRNVLRMESKRCLRSWLLLSFFRKKKYKFG